MDIANALHQAVQNLAQQITFGLQQLGVVGIPTVLTVLTTYGVRKVLAQGKKIV